MRTTINCVHVLVTACRTLAVGMAIAVAHPCAGDVTFINLGVLPCGQSTSGSAICGDGSIVVGYGVGPAAHEAYWWSSPTGLETFITGTDTSYALAISTDGTIVVGDYEPSPSSVRRAFRWTSTGEWLDLGVLPGASIPFSRAAGVSADGAVVVGTSNSAAGPRGFRWTSAGGMLNLGEMPGASETQAHAVSGDGSITVGVAFGSDLGALPIRWTYLGGAQPLAMLPGARWGEAIALSTDGSVIVGSCELPSGYRAVRWTSSGVQALDLPPGFDGHTFATCVSADGSTVAGQIESTELERPFIWRSALGMLDLQAYLTSLGINLTDWELNAATGLSADGTTVCGTGFYKGQRRAWIAKGLPLVPLAPAACALADITSVGGPPLGPDGQLTLDDILAFVNAFGDGCPP